MKKILFGLIIALTPALCGTQVSANRAIKKPAAVSKGIINTGDYRALIIAINDYKDPAIPDLKTPLNDAKTLNSILKNKYGFKTELLIGKRASRKGIYRKLRSFSSSADKGDSLLIYYAGHGERDRVYNDGWWIPYDANGGEADTYLDNTIVQKAMKSTAARHVLLISDSCYSGALLGSSRAIPHVLNNKYYENIYSEKSRWGITSGNKEPVSDDGIGGHSIFAYQLIKALKKNDRPYFSAQELYTNIAPIIGNNSEQTPICRPVRNTGDQGGQFIFLLASAGGYIDTEVSDSSAQYAMPTDSDKKKSSFISVTANIPGALVFIDGVKKGRSGMANIRVEPGKHTIRVEANGYQTYTKGVTIRSGRKISLQAYLDKVQEPKAALYVDTEPATASVKIINIKQGFYQGIELEKGQYQVEISLEGYTPVSRWVELETGEDEAIFVRLEKPKSAVSIDSDKQISNTIGMKFVYVKPGTFSRRRTLRNDFYMQTTEVTQKQWRSVMGNNPSFFKNCDNCPVEKVSWNDAQDFIRNLNIKEGINKYRLPTETEWEYSCRAGSDTDYAGGNSLEVMGWYSNNSGKETHPVALKKANSLGLYDMHGNVGEWCSDYYLSIFKRFIDPTVLISGSSVVIRGGSWRENATVCSSSFRRGGRSRFSYNYVGFRLARSI